MEQEVSMRVSIVSFYEGASGQLNAQDHSPKSLRAIGCRRAAGDVCTADTAGGELPNGIFSHMQLTLQQPSRNSVAL